MGYQINQLDHGIWLDQDHYAMSVEVPSIPVTRSTEKKAALTSQELSLYRALVGSINWIVCGSRPDAYFELIELSTKFRCALVEDWFSGRAIDYVVICTNQSAGPRVRVVRVLLKRARLKLKHALFRCEHACRVSI